VILGEWPYRYDHLTRAPVNYRIQILKVGEAEVPGPEVFWMSHWGTWEKLHFYMVVVRGNGITAVINTGPPSDLSALNTAWQNFAGERCCLKRTPEEQPIQALAKAGVNPDDVDYVLLTPLQAYATANIQLFPKARICFSKRGWAEDIMARPDYLHIPRQLCIPDETLHYLLFPAWERVSLLEDEDEICPGIRAWWAGTHHRSSMVYVIETQAGPVAIGDCAFKYANLNGHPLGIGESLAEGAAGYRRIRKEAAHFIPLYDPEVLERYPGGEIA
jgi:glyoxylase-like metal-dependent hydrolase (beta-lactamase superfamily II)